jgi:hypothetical protein
MPADVFASSGPMPLAERERFDASVKGVDGPLALVRLERP